MTFANRHEAGRVLARRLGKYAGRRDVVVLGIPRGGLPVASEVAEALQAPLDILLLRKLGVPGCEELAFGAIASGGAHVLDRSTVQALSISRADIEAVTTKEHAELKRRESAYCSDRATLSVSGKTVIVVDDGIATGASMLAGIQTLRQLRPARIVIAVPVAPHATRKRLAREVDDFVCVAAPELFFAVGQYYDDFPQVTDEEVVMLLERNRRAAIPAVVP